MLRFENVIELVDKLFYRDSDETVYISDMDSRQIKAYSEMTIKELKQYKVDSIDGIIVTKEGNIYIKMSK